MAGHGNAKASFHDYRSSHFSLSTSKDVLKRLFYRQLHTLEVKGIVVYLPKTKLKLVNALKDMIPRNYLVLIVLIQIISVTAKAIESPNVILIFTDDQGYNDLGCYGSKTIKTPNLDKMASEGIRFTDFYVGASFCSPSRAAPLTGCYPGRVGFGPGVLRPDADYGLAKDEFTMTEMFKSKGCATKCIGKWHIGFKKPFLPLAHGFDEYFGILHNMDAREVDDFDGVMPLYRNDKIIQELDTLAELGKNRRTAERL